MPGARKKVEPEAEAEIPQRWRLTWQGRTWVDDDLTGADVLAIVRIVGNDWTQLSPLHGPVHLIAFLTVLGGEPVIGAKATEILDALTFE